MDSVKETIQMILSSVDDPMMRVYDVGYDKIHGYSLLYCTTQMDVFLESLTAEQFASCMHWIFNKEYDELKELAEQSGFYRDRTSVTRKPKAFDIFGD